MATTAAILAVGDELLSGLTIDTNTVWLAQRLAERGVNVVEAAIVDDDRTRIAAAIERLSSASSQHNLLIITGGLGPTPDDLTREALGDVLTPDEELAVDEGWLAQLESWFARTGRRMPRTNRKQAMRPRGAELIPNARGTAPGIRAERGRCTIIVLPGVPGEMRAMFDANADAIAGRSPEGGEVSLCRWVRCCGIGESAAAERLGDLLKRDRRPRVGTAAGHSIVEARVYATGPRETIEPEIERTLREIESVLHPYSFARGEVTMAAALGIELQERRLTIATAESCTGGLIGAMLTETPGSSAYYRGGWVTYSNELKERCLGVRGESLRAFGAVSEQVAREMAAGAMAQSGADMSISITGIAGPDGGSEQKPVGTVFIGCGRRGADGDEAEITVRPFRFSGDRDGIRQRAASIALQMARLGLLGALDRTPLLWEIAKRASARG